MRAPFWTFRLACRLSFKTLPLLAVAFCTPLVAANPDSQALSEAKVESAQALLEEAIACEIYGLSEKRDELLAKAEALAPDHPAVKWQRGMILAGGKWTPAEELAVDSANRAVIAEYVAKRDASADTLADHLSLANWCRERHLYDQERSHLTRALTFDHEHAAARARLGFVRIEGRWVGPDELAHALAERLATQALIARHGTFLRNLAVLSSNESPSVRGRGMREIRAIRDASMIPGLESLVAGVGQEASLAVLEALAAMPEKEAALSLARFAVFSPSERVRTEASERLKGRSFDHFVPEMLACMTTPVRGEFMIARRYDQRLVYRHTFYREAMQASQVLVQDTVYADSQPPLDPIAKGTFDDDRIHAWIAGDYGLRAAMTNASVKYANGRVVEINYLVGETLTKLTGEQLGGDPHAWWTWWEQHNELQAASQKPVEVQFAYQSIESPIQEVDPDRPRQTQPGGPRSCFAAGTPVLTNRGDVAIEQVRAGDLVLAQDVESGEIAFKPVLETTVRPPAELLRVEHEKGSFRCTGGHPFWVSGEGWVHAKRLASGMELHSLDGSVRVSDVVSDGSEETYNLIVADFANYFVGEARILSHDNSSRRPTDAIVPGLEQK